MAVSGRLRRRGRMRIRGSRMGGRSGRFSMVGSQGGRTEHQGGAKGHQGGQTKEGTKYVHGGPYFLRDCNTGAGTSASTPRRLSWRARR